MQKLFKKVPLRENYKETVDEYVRLKAPPNVSRACFIFELSVAAAAFAISFYISFTSTTSVTSITYESLDSPYVCKVLSPRSDLLSFSAKSSEVVAFSSSRYGYDDCLTALGEDGNDVCADGNRQDFVVSLVGVRSNDDSCLDLALNNAYRFCSTSLLQFTSDVENFPTSPSQPSTAYDNAGSSTTMYYFANTSDTIHAFSAQFGDLQSGWVSYEDSVFVVAESSTDHKNYIYEFALGAGSTSTSTLTSVTQHTQVQLGSATLTGFSVANDVAYVWMAKSSTEGSIFSYDMETKTQLITNIDCSEISDDEYSTPSTGGASRMFHAADDGYLYAMCGSTPWNNAFTFYQIDADTMAATQLHVDIQSIPLIGGAGEATNVTSIKSIYATGGYAYLTTGDPTNNLLQVDLSAQPTKRPTAQPSRQPTVVPTNHPTPAQPSFSPTYTATAQPTNAAPPGSSPPPTLAPTITPTATPTNGGAPLGPPPVVRRRMTTDSVDSTAEAVVESSEVTPDSVMLLEGPPVTPPTPSPFDTLQPAVNLGTYRGAYMSKGFGNTIYFNTESGVPKSEYYNITSDSFDAYDDLYSDYFRAVSIQLGYAYAMCNEQILNVTIDPTVSTDYKTACGAINGIYYQKNEYFTVPQSCAGVFLSDGSNFNLQTISTCPGLEEIAANFTSTDCESSFAKICSAAYTDNPPFSCTIDEHPDFLTTLGSALSNASALWALIAVIISVSLRRAYPGGVLARDFDVYGGKKYQSSNKNSAVVYPLAEVDEGGNNMHGGDDGVELGRVNSFNSNNNSPNRPLIPVTQQPDDAFAPGNASDRTKPQPGQQPHQEEGKEGYCEMLCDEFTGC